MVNLNTPLNRVISNASSHSSEQDQRVPAKNVVAEKGKAADFAGTDDWTVPDAVKQHPLFVAIEPGSNMSEAFRQLDQKMQARGLHHLISHKAKHSWGGQRIEAGTVGLLEYSGAPVLAPGPANYWNWSPTHSWHGKLDLTQQIAALGLTAGQVGQSDAMVVKDPSNQVFVIRNGGFASFGAEGRFDIIAIVDTLNLGPDTDVREDNRPDGPILGQRKEILSGERDEMGRISNPRVVATFFNVPANNVVVVQQADRMQALLAGQHVITNPHTTFRAFYTLSERQWAFKTQPAYTQEGVPVRLDVNLRYRIIDPIKLTRHYPTAAQALMNPAQGAVNAVVSRMSYQQFMRAAKVGGDGAEAHSSPFVDAFKAESMIELREQAESYGILVESFTVLDRQWSDQLGKDLEKAAEQVMQNQVEGTQVALKNRIATEKQEGQLQIAQVQQKQTTTEADAQLYKSNKEADAKFYNKIKEVDAAAEAIRRNAAAEAEAQKVRTAAQVENIRALAEAEAKRIEVVSKAYADVTEGHARTIQLQTLEVEKRKALPSNTVYFSSEAGETALASNVTSAFTSGLAASKGVAQGMLTNNDR